VRNGTASRYSLIRINRAQSTHQPCLRDCNLCWRPERATRREKRVQCALPHPGQPALVRATTQQTMAASLASARGTLGGMGGPPRRRKVRIARCGRLLAVLLVILAL
jgi:hypothetical protein